MSSGVATYYDRLGRWNRFARAVGYGGGSSTLTVHRALADPRAGGAPTFTRLHDLVIEQVQAHGAVRVLDAGCGLGGTMLALARGLGAQCVGVTLSRSQADTANAAAARAGCAGQVRAVVCSYDTPPEGPFDLIVAIESLAHSASPSASVRALASVLAPGGRVIVVDDMPDDSALGEPDLSHFKRGWQCPVLWTAREYASAFAAEGLRLERELDLTAACRPRPEHRIARLMWLNRLVRRLPSEALRQVMDSHFGGLALERLTRRGQMRYTLLVARRPELTVS